MSAGLNLNIGDDDPDYPAMVLVDYIFGGGGFLNSRLARRIRQKEGLELRRGFFLSVDPLDKSGSLTYRQELCAQNVAKVEIALREEFASTIKDGFTREEVEAAKAGLLQEYKLGSLSNDSSLARMLINYLFLNRTMKWEDEFEKRIAA